MRLYSYILTVDSGFAPNPFHRYCTLATCKPLIRRTAQPGDWIIGTGSKRRKRDGFLVYAMRVTESMTFEEYWNDPRFLVKRPDKTAGRERGCGDNIYYVNPDTNQLCQVEECYHCEADIWRDIKTDRVLVSDDFIYWGGDGPPMPPEFRDAGVLKSTQGHKCKFPESIVVEFVGWIRGLGDKGRCGNPLDWV